MSPLRGESSNTRLDYDANRGPLDGRQYTRRQPDGFSTVAGCLFIVLWCLISGAFGLWVTVNIISAVVGR